MSELKHTPEPWKVTVQENGYVCIETAYGTHRDILTGDFITLKASNAERIVACVNACEGLNPEAIPEMLEALQEMVSVACEYYDMDMGDAGSQMIAIANDVIAKATGKETS